MADRKSRSGTGKEAAREGVTITHPEKVLFPEDGITKSELAAYYDAIAPHMLPHIAGRPITMEFYTLDRDTIESEIRTAGLEIVEVLERDPYPPPIEHQSRRAYLFARKPRA